MINFDFKLISFIEEVELLLNFTKMINISTMLLMEHHNLKNVPT